MNEVLTRQECILSSFILKEFKETLLSQKFGFPLRVIDLFVNYLRQYCLIREEDQSFSFDFPDATDHKILALCRTVKADFLIIDEDFSKVSQLLKKGGYEEISSNKVFARFGNNKFYFMDVDFMFVDRQTFLGIMKGSKPTKIAHRKFTVPCLDHLIALKLHSIKFNIQREYKDLLDIIQLTKVNKVDIKTNKFKNLCLKYGTEVLYNKIVSLGS